MNPHLPTIQDSGRVQKEQHREIGNWLARRIGRPSAVYGCWLAIRLGLTAHQVTMAALITNPGRSHGDWFGRARLFILGVVLAQFAFWLDHVDGQVARWRKTASLDGVYFDYLMHHATTWCWDSASGMVWRSSQVSRTGRLRASWWRSAGHS